MENCHSSRDMMGGWRESEQIAEVYEYMSGKTGATEIKKDEEVGDKEMVLILIKKKK